jgi:prepilin-type N-terminal cleavage/methylation domain-containing protein
MGVSRPPESKVVFASAECPHYIRPRNDELIKSYRRPQGEGTRAKAFTLAEVLITLGIIGIVAALTMPALIADYKEKAAVVKVKKAYNVLSNAYNLALMENGELNSWFTNMAISDSARRVNSPIFFEKIKPHLNIIKDCGLNSGCLTPGTIHAMNGSNGDGPLDTNDRQYKFVLADGTLVSLTVYIPGCKTNEVCGAIGIDVDGLKGPYAWGLDWFTFNFTPERLVPRGAPNDPGGETFAAACTKTTGYGCTGWVIINENMDYLHCDDLSWNGKTKCK